jgi:DNA (cytosine-5)-methyltransferase 1
MANVRAATADCRFTFGSGFSGAGGADIGYGLAGGRSIFAIEIDPEAVRSFQRNFPETSVTRGDFRAVTASRDEIGRFLIRTNLGRGDLDIFHASPPCNEFSRLGRGPTEGGTSDLIFDVVRATKTMRPRVLVIENVPELGGRYRYILEAALRSLCFEETGRRLYYARSEVLSASDFGVAQRRRRLFVIAVRSDVGQLSGITSDEVVSRLFPEPLTVPMSVETALTGLQQSEIDIHPFRRAMMTSNLGDLVRRLPRDPNNWTRPRHIGLGNYRFSTVRAAALSPSPTLTASGQQPDGRSGVIHPLEDRKFSIPELKRLSAWPDDYRFTGTVNQVAERIGMCVPPLMAKAIGDAVYGGVLRRYHESVGRRPKHHQTTRS